LIGFHTIAGALPLDFVSDIFGAVARVVGPRLGITRRARRNIERALPELTAAEHERIIRRMWDNLGRTAAEYAHLNRIKCFGPGARVEVLGTEHLDRALALGKPVFFFSGHFGNWEIACVAAVQYGLDVAQVYRAANNPAVEAFMLEFRRSLGVDPISKGAAGARRIIGALRGGKTLAMLVDQKMNDGIPVPFFGRDAMTAPALAELGLRYGCALLPGRVDRIGGAHFRLTVFPPIEIEKGESRREKILAIMTDVNRVIEGWIRERPEQWFWLHRRWPD
jgi:Kdo2-lipid IVA lauroyltransferase/acyltransferase